MDLGGGPAHFPKLLETEYKLNNSDTSFAQLDQEERQQREAEATMLLAMAAAPLADAKQYGPGDIAFGNNVYDNIESQGTQGNFKGSDFSWKPPTDAENPASTGTMPEDAAALHEGIDGPGDGSTKPYASSRPKYGSTQIDDVWNAHVDPETDAVQDPSGATIEWDRTKPRNGQWDMGHIPDQKYSDVHARYMNGEMSLDEFLDWYRNPQNYRPELPKTNRSRVYEGGGTYSK